MSEGDRTSRKRKKVRQDDEDEAPSQRRKTSSVASMDDTEMELAAMSQVNADPVLRERVDVCKRGQIVAIPDTFKV